MTSESELSTLSLEFKSLNKLKGHYQGEEWNEVVDPFNSQKHQTMNQLLALISIGSNVKYVTDTMGKPDEIIIGKFDKSVGLAPIHEDEEHVYDASVTDEIKQAVHESFIPYTMPGPVIPSGYQPNSIDSTCTLVYCRKYYRFHLIKY